MEKHKNTLHLDNKDKIVNTTDNSDTKQKPSTSNFQQRLAVISKKLNLCYLINFK
ncbi:MAG: hypothetical protein HRT53_01300 [Colwellia sp.]|nr:hypothetical protein [Colwellia sp.]